VQSAKRGPVIAIPQVGGLFAQTPVPDTVLIDRNVEYSAVGWRQLMDIVRPRDLATNPRPAVLLLHGGGFRAPAKAAGPRATSKTAPLIEMLRTPGGATLEGICKKFGWQAHTTRALMSAGGLPAKKHGITVISEKVGDSRTYRIAR
jgi:hypothetical protein